jgi:Flp pilus assembly pilin Flp
MLEAPGWPRRARGDGIVSSPRGAVRRARALYRDQSGATAVEYGLLLAVGIGLAFLLVYLFGSTLNSARTNMEGGKAEGRYDAGGSGGDGGFILHRSVEMPAIP